MADHADARDRAVGETFADHRGKRSLTYDGAQRVALAGDLAAQCLGEAVGRLGDFLEQEVGCIAAVDVARGHFRVSDVIAAERQVATVVRKSRDSVEVAGRSAIEHHDLAALLTVHPDIPLGFLNYPVRLARHDEAVVTETDVETLAAATQGEKERRRRSGGSDAYCDGAFERCDSPTK